MRVGEAGSAIVIVVACMLPRALASKCPLSKGMESVDARTLYKGAAVEPLDQKNLNSRLGSARTQLMASARPLPIELGEIGTAERTVQYNVIESVEWRTCLIKKSVEVS